MYAFQSAGQLSIEEFHVPFGGKLDPSNQWVVLASVIPWVTLEKSYAPQFSAKTGPPANPFRMAFGPLYIQQRLRVTDLETVELTTESPYLEFFIGLLETPTVQSLGIIEGISTPWRWAIQACSRNSHRSRPYCWRLVQTGSRRMQQRAPVLD
jgi:hypothetical protein